MIRVTNGKQTGFIGENKIYIGRRNPYYNLNKSPLANPFKIGRDGQGMEVIRKYRLWLWQQIKSENPAVLQELEMIKEESLKGDIDLVCWCHPAPCHGEVVKSCIEWLIGKQYMTLK